MLSTVLKYFPSAVEEQAIFPAILCVNLGFSNGKAWLFSDGTAELTHHTYCEQSKIRTFIDLIELEQELDNLTTVNLF